MSAASGKNSKLILAAMIFAVSMTFIDQTSGAGERRAATRWMPAGKVEPGDVLADKPAPGSA